MSPNHPQSSPSLLPPPPPPSQRIIASPPSLLRPLPLHFLPPPLSYAPRRNPHDRERRQRNGLPSRRIANILPREQRPKSPPATSRNLPLAPGHPLRPAPTLRTPHLSNTKPTRIRTDTNLSRSDSPPYRRRRQRDGSSTTTWMTMLPKSVRRTEPGIGARC